MAFIKDKFSFDRIPQKRLRRLNRTINFAPLDTFAIDRRVLEFITMVHVGDVGVDMLIESFLFELSP